MQRRDFRRAKYEPMYLNPEDYSELPCRKRGTIQYPTIEHHETQPISKPRTLSSRGYSVGQQLSTRNITILKDTSESDQSIDDDLMRHVQPAASWLSQLLTKKAQAQRVENKQQPDERIQQHQSLFKTICKEQATNTQAQSAAEQHQQVVDQPILQKQETVQVLQADKQGPFYRHIQPEPSINYQDILSLLRLPRETKEQPPVEQPIERQVSTFTFTEPPKLDLTIRYSLLQQILINISSPIIDIERYVRHVDQSVEDMSEQRVNIQQLRTFKKQAILQLSSVICTAICHIKQHVSQTAYFSNLLRYNLENCGCLLLIKLSQLKPAQALELQKFIDTHIEDESLSKTSHVYRIANNNNTIAELISKCMKDLPEYEELRTIVKNVHRRNVTEDYRQLRLLLCRTMDKINMSVPQYLYEAPTPYLADPTNKTTLLIYIDHFLIAKHDKLEVRAHAAEFLVSLSKQFQVVTYSTIGQDDVDSILDSVHAQVGTPVISHRLYRYHAKEVVDITKLGRAPDKLIIVLDRSRQGIYNQSSNVYYVNVWRGRQGSLVTRQLHDIIGRLQGQSGRPRQANHQRRRSMK